MPQRLMWHPGTYDIVKAYWGKTTVWDIAREVNRHNLIKYGIGHWWFWATANSIIWAAWKTGVIDSEYRDFALRQQKKSKAPKPTWYTNDLPFTELLDELGIKGRDRVRLLWQCWRDSGKTDNYLLVDNPTSAEMKMTLSRDGNVIFEVRGLVAKDFKIREPKGDQ